MLKITNIKKLNSDTVSKVNWRIAELTKNTFPYDPLAYFAFVYASYLASEYKAENPEALIDCINREISDQRAMFVIQASKDCLDVSIQIAKEFGADDLLSYLYDFPREYVGKTIGESGTPKSLAMLALRLLDIQVGEKLADFGSGVGDFIIQASEYHDNDMYGIDINTWVCEISKIRAELFATNVSLELGDMFSMPKEKKYDKVFSNYPFGMRLLHLSTGSNYIEELHKRIPDIKKATSSDWLFNSLIVDHLADQGKAVSIMTNGSTWNSIDEKIREYFIRNGLIEAVISLPSRMFDYSNIPTTMIVFSRGNKSIRLIDATALCEQGRRQNTLTDANIDRIIELLSEDSDESIVVDNDIIKENNSVINPSRYLTKVAKVEDGVQFDTLIKRITRGAPIRASELDDMVSEEPTDTQYLMLANIQNGMIAEDLPYLKELDEKLNKYCIHDRNLLLSKNGAPFKVAVAEVEEGRKVLGNGNLFIIELDEEKVNPYFIKAFFDSDIGVAALNSITVGATIPNISAESLKKLIVPSPPIERQNEIANLYQAKQDEIKVLQLKIQKAQNELRGIFGEVV